MKRCSFFYFMVVYTLVFSSYGRSAREENPLPPTPEAYKFEKVFKSKRLGITQKLTIHTRRFKRAGAPPLILSHALILNSIAMEGLGKELWKKGYDVWMPNMRGHGNGKEKSIIYPYLPGDYGFDKIEQCEEGQEVQEATRSSFTRLPAAARGQAAHARPR